MGKIKKIIETELVGGTQSTDIYPVTSIKAVYDEDNERLDNIINRKSIVNISTNYNADHIAETLNLNQAISKVPLKDRVLGFQGKYLSLDGWHTILYTGENISNWDILTNWIDVNNTIFKSLSKNATFAGIATPDTNPGVPDGPVFYIANTEGIYSNFGNLIIEYGESSILQYIKSSWVKEIISSVNKSMLLSSMPLTRGVYFDLSKTPKGQLTEFWASKLTPFLYIPKKPCTFKYIWGGENVGSSFVYFDNSFKYVGESHPSSSDSYNFDPSLEVIPVGAKYMIVQFQDLKFEIITSELLNTGILYTNKVHIKKNTTDINLIYKDKFVNHTEINPYIKELYIHGKGITDKPLLFKQFISSDLYKGYLIEPKDKSLYLYTESLKDGYNKNVFYEGTNREVTIEIIADFSSTNIMWDDLDKDQDNTILKSAYDINYSPTIKEINDIKFKISGVKKRTKNLFNKESIVEGNYIITNSGLLEKNPETAISHLISVEPGKTYHLERPCISEDNCPITSEVRFLKKDTITPLKPIVNGYVSKTYYVNKDVTVTAPNEAAFFQFTLKFKNVSFDYDKIQFEEGDKFTGYIPYNVFVADYSNLPPDLNGLSDRVKNLEKTVVTETITIANSSKIGFFSNSFLNGYCMLGKHAINNLSMFSDYIMYNYGHSGDDLLEILDRVNKNQKWLGDVPVQDWGITYGVIAMQDNDGALYAASSDTYYENGKKLANAIKAMGGIPILGTEHDNNLYYYNFSRLSQDYNLMFMNWGLTASKLFKSVFKPFWYNSHPATRTAWMWTYGMKSFLNTLPRPKKSIKIFRVRPNIDTSDIKNLMYEDIISRAERFEELTCGVSCLTKDTEKYFDRIDTNNTKYQDYKDEYQKLQSNAEAVSLGNNALIEIITPYTKNNISSLVINTKLSNVSSVYIRKINSISNPLPSTATYVAFGIITGESLLPPGTRFEITGGVFNSNLIGTYEVEDIVNGLVVTKTPSSGKTVSGTDSPIINILGVTLKGSSKYPSANYMKRYNKPLGEWVKITNFQEGRLNLIDYLSTCMDFDKVSLLFVGKGMEISDISAIVSGTERKNTIPISQNQIIAKKGTSLLKKLLFDIGNNEWDGLDSFVIYSPVKSTVSEDKEPLPDGITTVRIMPKGLRLKQEIQISSIKNLEFSPATLQIRIIARYFPEYIDSDLKFEKSLIKRGSYDCAKLEIRIALSLKDNNSVKVGVINVGTWWNEFIIETPYFTGSHLFLEAEKDDIQIARCDVLQIE